MINNCKFWHVTFVNTVCFALIVTIVKGDSSPLLLKFGK